VLGEKQFTLTDASSNLRVSFRIENPQDQYLFLCLLENPAVAACTSLSRISGLMTVEHECTQDPPENIGIDRFERWTPVRRPMGHNLAMKIDPPVKAWSPNNIRNGVARPTKRANCWVPAIDPVDEAQMLHIKWSQRTEIRRLVVCFDTDFDHGKQGPCPSPKIY
jgi:hypothetical protein